MCRTMNGPLIFTVIHIIKGDYLWLHNISYGLIKLDPFMLPTLLTTIQECKHLSFPRSTYVCLCKCRWIAFNVRLHPDLSPFMRGRFFISFISLFEILSSRRDVSTAWVTKSSLWCWWNCNCYFWYICIEPDIMKLVFLCNSYFLLDTYLWIFSNSSR